MKRERKKKIVNACNGKIKIYIFNVIPMHVMIQQLTYMCVLNMLGRTKIPKFIIHLSNPYYIDVQPRLTHGRSCRELIITPY